MEDQPPSSSASKKVPSDNVPQIDREIFEWHNKLRKDPKCLIQDLKDLEDKFDGPLLKRPGMVTLRTKEGKEAVMEAIKFLKDTHPI